MKILLAVVMAASLVGCSEAIQIHNEVEIFPGAELLMVSMCDSNSGFVRGTVSEANLEAYRSARVIEYRTKYNIECVNGAKITKTFSRKVED